jgi:hypothetical protein
MYRGAQIVVIDPPSIPWRVQNQTSSNDYPLSVLYYSECKNLKNMVLIHQGFTLLFLVNGTVVDTSLEKHFNRKRKY